jgi:hypothetical protein
LRRTRPLRSTPGPYRQGSFSFLMEGCESGRIGTTGNRVSGNRPWVRIPPPPPLALLLRGCSRLSRLREVKLSAQSKTVRGRGALNEPRWPADIAVLVAIGLYLVLPNRLVVGLGPRWLIPALEGALLLALVIERPRRVAREPARDRVAAICLVGLINMTNVATLGELIHTLLYNSNISGRDLIYASVPVWLTTVVVYALWFWELDRGGPAARLQGPHGVPDFWFPQMSIPEMSESGWSPKFVDYLYTSCTNSTAFSPTDTMPLSAWAKLLMMLQSLSSLLTVALVISGAVSIVH